MHEEINSVPRTDIEKPAVVEQACNLGSWEAKTDRFLGLLVGQPS